MRIPFRHSYVRTVASGFVVAALALAGCGGSAVPGTKGGGTTSTAAPVAGGSGFGTVRVLVRNAAGEMVWCVLLAATPEQRERGLMEVTDPSLNGFAGMLFRFPTDSTDEFWMRNTPMPLSIAYVDGGGQVVSSTDMAPCEDRDDCPVYPADGTFRMAIEVPQGQLDDLGITKDSTVVDTRASC
jgi:uncharacterized membrane protein (UPF0127 family)